VHTLFKLLFLLVLAAAAWAAWALLVPVKPQKETFVLLRPGWSTRRIARELKSNDLIRSEDAFLFYHYIVHPRSLKAGEYRFADAETPMRIHERLAAGDIFTHTVVIPEGFNIYDVASAVETAGLGSRADFLKAAQNDTALVHDVDPQAKSLEGYLFPDTYEFTRTQSMSDIVSAMVRRFRQEAKAIGLDSDYHRVVTLASIVEKETAARDERPMVASVYENRIQRNMALDADPSVIYGSLLIGKYNGTIYQSDLTLDSPYNTYKYPGLPPGPIANPGRDSLKAAMHPAASDYLFFVADGTGDGHHRFAKTLEEHSRNVAAYRRATAEAR
jgi:UPF0755 protein